MNRKRRTKKNLLKHIIHPMIMMIIIIGLFVLLPFRDTFHPQKLDNIWDLESGIHKHDYVSTTVDTLYYSGYDISQFGTIDFGYYYALKDGRCIFVLIPVSEHPEETIENFNITGRIIGTSERRSFKHLVEEMADDLGWSEIGIRSVTCDLMISSADYHPAMYAVLGMLLLIGIVLALYLTFNHLKHYWRART